MPVNNRKPNYGIIIRANAAPLFTAEDLLAIQNADMDEDEMDDESWIVKRISKLMKGDYLYQIEFEMLADKLFALRPEQSREVSRRVESLDGYIPPITGQIYTSTPSLLLSYTYGYNDVMLALQVLPLYTQELKIAFTYLMPTR